MNALSIRLEIFMSATFLDMFKKGCFNFVMHHFVFCHTYYNMKKTF